MSGVTPLFYIEIQSWHTLKRLFDTQPYIVISFCFLLQITDFWKEALMLSSLHHPNVVSFYGIVRDGPDSSLATVTEFMINGSLKQFLHKKDR